MRTPGGGMQEWLLRLCPEWLDTWDWLEAGGSSLTWGTLQALVEGWILFDRDLERVRIETAVRHPPLKANLATALTFFTFILIPSCCCSFLPLVTPNLCILKMWCKSLLADEWCAGALTHTWAFAGLHKSAHPVSQCHQVLSYQRVLQNSQTLDFIHPVLTWHQRKELMNLKALPWQKFSVLFWEALLQ